VIEERREKTKQTKKPERFPPFSFSLIEIRKKQSHKKPLAPGIFKPLSLGYYQPPRGATPGNNEEDARCF
jgi:hypothetical protein